MSLGTFLLRYLRMIRVANFAPLHTTTTPLIFPVSILPTVSWLKKFTWAEYITANVCHQLPSHGGLRKWISQAFYWDVPCISESCVCTQSRQVDAIEQSQMKFKRKTHLQPFRKKEELLQNSAKVESCIGEKKEALLSFCPEHLHLVTAVKLTCITQDIMENMI